MLPERIEALKRAPITLTSTQVIDKYLEVRSRLINAWQTSQSNDYEGREDLFRQLKGLDAVIDQLFNNWS